MASKRQSLLEYLKTLLAGITTGNGYNFTVKTVKRGVINQRTLNDNQLPALFIVMTHEKRKRITVNQFSAELQAIIVGYVKNTKGDFASTGTGVELDLDKLIEDVTKIIEADPLQSGLVYDTEIQDIVSDDGDLTPNAGFMLSVVFKYASEGITP